MKKLSPSQERRALVSLFADLGLSPEQLGVVLTSFLDDSTPIQRLVKDLVQRADYLSLAGLSVDPRVYEDSEVYFWDRQATEFLRKYPFKGMEADAKYNALETFRKAEQACKETNARFAASGSHLHSESERTLVKQVRRYIRSVLGQFSSEEMLDEARHGPGSCQGLTDFGLDVRGCTGGEFKFESKISLTPNLGSIAVAVLEQYPNWDSASKAAHGAETRFTQVVGNKITTVPKTALTDRVIAIEPMLNVFLQLGIGGMMRRRLGSRAGFNIDDSWRKNQELAKEGSITGFYSTIDLSSASDMIAYNVVGTLLPREWFRALAFVRSPVGSIRHRDGLTSIVEYQKFSSMGNGATFELETLIFWAICRACGVPSEDLAVFGDDIVVPTTYSESVLSALRFFGMEPNLKKTFVAGPFRESCGKDYFLGRDVRPLYVTKDVQNGQQLVNLANSVRDLGVRRNQAAGFTDSSADYRFAPGWHYLVGCIPKAVRNAISSPPHTAFGLWKGGLRHETTATGEYKPRWRIYPTPKKVGVSFVGLGLLAARLSSIAVSTTLSFDVMSKPNRDNVIGFSLKPWEGPFTFRVEEGSGGGNSAICAGQLRWNMKLAVDTGSLGEWGGWA